MAEAAGMSLDAVSGKGRKGKGNVAKTRRIPGLVEGACHFGGRPKSDALLLPQQTALAVTRGWQAALYVPPTLAPRGCPD